MCGLRAVVGVWPGCGVARGGAVGSVRRVLGTVLQCVRQMALAWLSRCKTHIYPRAQSVTGQVGCCVARRAPRGGGIAWSGRGFWGGGALD
jgi:hypothetical protein